MTPFIDLGENESKFHFGTYVKARVQEALGLMDMKIIGHAGITAIQGSTAAQHVTDYLKEYNRDYLQLSHSDLYGIAALSAPSLIQNCLEKDRFLVIRDAQAMSGSPLIIQAVLDLMDQPPWNTCGLFLCGSSGLYEQSDLKPVVDKLDLFMLFKRK